MPKHVPRFIPTLTEVVDPASISAAPTSTSPDTQTLLEQVQRELCSELDRRLQQEFEQFQRGVLGEQLEAMRQRLWRDMDEMVRQAVADALSREDGRDDDSQPRVFTDSHQPPVA